MPRNNDTPVIQDGDAEVTGQLQAGTVAVQDRVLSQISNKLAVDGQVLVTEAQRNAMNGYAGLDENGKILAAALPEIGISRVYVVATQAAQLALTADEGDLAIRSDLSRSFVHNGGTSGTMSDWLELARTSDHVYSVAGKVGAVELEITDIDGLSAALAAAATAVHTHTLSDITDAGTAASKNAPASGDATSSQVVLGSDTRLTDTRDPKAHTHSTSDVTGLSTALDGKAASSHTHTTADITNAGTAATKDVPSGGDATSGQVVLGSDTRLTDARTPSPHSHQISDVTSLQTALDGKASASHTHTTASITDAGTAATRNTPSSGDASSTEVVLGSDTRLTDARTPAAHKSSHATGGTDALSASDIGAAESSHTHTLSAITDAGTAASLNAPASGDAGTGELVKGNDTRLTDSRTPTSHTHAISDVTNLQTTLDGKVSSTDERLMPAIQSGRYLPGGHFNMTGQVLGAATLAATNNYFLGFVPDGTFTPDSLAFGIASAQSGTITLNASIYEHDPDNDTLDRLFGTGDVTITPGSGKIFRIAFSSPTALDRGKTYWVSFNQRLGTATANSSFNTQQMISPAMAFAWVPDNTINYAAITADYFQYPLVTFASTSNVARETSSVDLTASLGWSSNTNSTHYPFLFLSGTFS
jgi:hypothetical protein